MHPWNTCVEMEVTLIVPLQIDIWNDLITIRAVMELETVKIEVIIEKKGSLLIYYFNKDPKYQNCHALLRQWSLFVLFSTESPFGQILEWSPQQDQGWLKAFGLWPIN